MCVCVCVWVCVCVCEGRGSETQRLPVLPMGDKILIALSQHYPMDYSTLYAGEWRMINKNRP
jgi:hypothetical protein